MPAANAFIVRSSLAAYLKKHEGIRMTARYEFRDSVLYDPKSLHLHAF